MVIDERSRHGLYLKLEQVLGQEEATTLMEHLPPIGWADVATKQDLDQLRAATKQDLDQLQAATKQDLDQLQAATKQDLGELQAATKQDLDQLQAATKQDLDQLQAATKHDLGELRDDLEQFRVATKHDLGELRTAMDQIRADFAQQFQTQELAITAIFRGELIALQKHMVFAMMGLMVSVAALAFAIGPFI